VSSASYCKSIPQPHEAKRVLLLGWLIGSGSTGVYTYELAEYLVSMGYAVTCLSAGKCDWRLKPRVVVQRTRPFEIIELRNPPIFAGARPANPATDIDSPETIRLLRGVVSRVRAKVVAIMDFPGWPAATVKVCQEADAKVVIVLHNFWPFCNRLALFDRYGNVCHDYENGSRCVSCMQNVVGSTTARWRARLPKALWRYTLLHSSLKRLYRFSLDAYGVTSSGHAPSYAARRSAYVQAVTRADRLCCISDRTAELAASFGATNPKIAITPILLSHMKTLHQARLRAVASLGSPQLPLRFGYIGNYDPMKGIEVAIEAFRGISREQAALHCYGGSSPDYLRRLKRLACPGNPPIFHGQYRRDDLPFILADVDVGIVPSTCEDTRPNVVLEFQAAGIPVIGSKIGGIPEQIDHGRNGLLFKPASAAALHAAISTVVRSPEMIVEWRSNLPSVFEPESSWRQMENIFAELVDED
jgi:glycosyltransferase involved in cell wall biosynthesis